jgi:hypothetical protein
MTRMPSAVSWSVGLLLSWAALACEPGGVGDPCTPEDEYQQDFNGFQVTETNVESRSFQCATRLCLVNHFQGRVSCRLGQTATEGPPFADPLGPKDATNLNMGWAPKCSIPGTAVDRRDPMPLQKDVGRLSKDNINVAVPAQLRSRQTEQAVYCSCRCDGPDKNARYCECPEGFQCEPLVDDLKITEGAGQLAGSYCIRAGSKYNPIDHFKGAADCAAAPNECGCDKSVDPADWNAECGAQN